MVPALIGRYRVLELVGRGSMGTVYRCRDESLERDVAVKVMSGAQSAEPAARARFAREARAAARLQHPNIITIFELRENNDPPFIAMEYLDGVDLQRAISAGIRPDPKVTLPIVLQILAGLAHAHEHDIVHRDVKPSNIFLPRGRPAKIMDFGVARLAGGTTTAGTLVGTPNYMSPEQVAAGAVDGRSDIFSSGLILYELVTGERAYTGSSIVGVLYKIANERPDLSLLPRTAEWDTLRRVVARALAHEPDERYPDARAMAGELVQALADLGGGPDWASASDRGLLMRHTPRARRRLEAVAPSSPPVEASTTPLPPPEPEALPAGEAAASGAPVWRWYVLGLGGLGVVVLAVATFALFRGRSHGRESAPAPQPSVAAPLPAPSTPAVAVRALSPSPQPTLAQSLAVTAPAATPAVAASMPAVHAQAIAPVPPAAGASPWPVAPVPPPAATPRPTLASSAPNAHLERANALLEAGRYQAALNEAQGVLARDRGNEEARAIVEDATAALSVEDRLRKARAALSRGARGEALAELTAGLAVAPHDARLLTLKRQIEH